MYPEDNIACASSSCTSTTSVISGHGGVFDRVLVAVDLVVRLVILLAGFILGSKASVQPKLVE